MAGMPRPRPELGGNTRTETVSRSLLPGPGAAVSVSSVRAASPAPDDRAPDFGRSSTVLGREDNGAPPTGADGWIRIGPTLEPAGE